MRIGIDVGGTNTDAVLMNGTETVGWSKSPTTSDVTGGIVSALELLLSQTRAPRAAIEAVMLGTTHFTNAVVERKQLLQVAAIRVALPATRALPPMVDWPSGLRVALGDHSYLVQGGYEFDGREIASLDEGEITRVAMDVRTKGIRSAAITSVFSPVNASMEKRVADILQSEVPDIFISLSSEIGRIGLIERENATLMNACLRDVARDVCSAFEDALRLLRIDAPFFISQNDGTLMTDEFAERYPVLTFASGPTNSMRGAAFLAGISDAVVVDIGGTTSDVGMLVRGFPRESSEAVEIAGVRTNFRMPDIFSFGLGGGSIVRANGLTSIGPDSVAFELSEKSRIFGGTVLTASDIAVAAGLASLGDPRRVDDLERGFVEGVIDQIQEMIDVAVDRMKISADLIPLVLVGGGAILVARPIAGTSEVIRPEFGSVANAIGAAIAQIGGEVDRVVSLATERLDRDEALARAKSEAIEKAAQAGAHRGSIHVIDVEDVPLTYLPGNAIRIRAKAVGDLVISATSPEQTPCD